MSKMPTYISLIAITAGILAACPSPLDRLYMVTGWISSTAICVAFVAAAVAIGSLMHAYGDERNCRSCANLWRSPRLLGLLGSSL